MTDRLALTVIAGGYAAGAYLYTVGNIPADVRLFVGLMLPIAASTIYAVFASLWRRDPSIDVETHVRAQRAIRRYVVLFTIALHLVLVASLGGIPLVRAWAPRIGVVLFGLLLVAVGNVLPRIRPNLVIGIRTPRTLRDRCLWMRLHRAGGYAAVAAGFVVIFSGLFLTRVQIAQTFHTAAIGTTLVLLVSYWRHRHA